MFDEIVNAAKGKQIVMFLDYDGTLSPIVEDPDKAFITHEVFILFLQNIFLWLIYLLIIFVIRFNNVFFSYR